MKSVCLLPDTLCTEQPGSASGHRGSFRAHPTAEQPWEVRDVTAGDPSRQGLSRHMGISEGKELTELSSLLLEKPPERGAVHTLPREAGVWATNAPEDA